LFCFVLFLFPACKCLFQSISRASM
jgi:hypothetical protein